jgi:hypothetical protein
MFRNQDSQGGSSSQRRLNSRLANTPSRQSTPFGNILLWFFFAYISLLVRLWLLVSIWERLVKNGEVFFA